MHELSDALRQATATAPPSSVDVDGLIVSHEVAVRRRRWMGGAAAAVLAVAMVGGGTVVLSGLGSGSGSGQTAGDASLPVGQSRPSGKPTSAQPSPTQTDDDPVARRLSADLLRAMRDQFAQLPPEARPRVTVTTPADGGEEHAVVGDEVSGYKGNLEIRDRSGSVDVSTLISKWEPGRKETCAGSGDLGSDASCHEVVVGGVAYLRIINPLPLGATSLELYVTFPDGTRIELLQDNYSETYHSVGDKTPSTRERTRPSLILTFEQMIAVAQQLTLNP